MYQMIKHEDQKLTEFSEKVFKTGFVGNFKDATAVYAIICAGRELGLPPMVSLRAFHYMNGKPVLSAEAMLALIKRSSLCRYFHLVDSTKENATYETLRVGEPAPTRISFTMAQARDAGLLGNPSWKKFPDAMLRARCVAALGRAVYPDVLVGIYTADEMGEKENAPERITAEIFESKSQPTSIEDEAERVKLYQEENERNGN